MKKREIDFLCEVRTKEDGQHELFLKERKSVIDQLISNHIPELTEFGYLEFKGVLRKVGKSKSKRKLGYFYAEILPKITHGLRDNGFWEIDDDITYRFLCKRFLGTRSIINKYTGEIMEEIPITLSEIDDDQMWEFMDKCIKFAGAELMVQIISPEEWKNNFT